MYVLNLKKKIVFYFSLKRGSYETGGFSTSNKVKNHCSRVKPVLLKSFFASDRILKVIIDLPSMINYVQSDHEVKIYNAAGSKPGLSPAQEGHTHPHHFQNH